MPHGEGSSGLQRGLLLAVFAPCISVLRARTVHGQREGEVFYLVSKRAVDDLGDGQSRIRIIRPRVFDREPVMRDALRSGIGEKSHGARRTVQNHLALCSYI